MTLLQDMLFAGAFPACQLLGLLALGWVFRVDRQPTGKSGRFDCKNRGGR